MPTLSRRAFGAAGLSAPALIASAAPLLARPQAAAAKPASVYGTTIGSYRVTALLDGCHLHFPSFGRIVRVGDAYRFAPASLLG